VRSSTLSGRPIDILIAEDDELTRENLRCLFELNGHRCAAAPDGARAVELAHLSRPRFVLLDLALPLLDGFAVARRLRGDARTRTAHIHCLSGLRGPHVREEAYRAGCETFLSKPVDVDALLGLVREQLRQPEIGAVSGLDLRQAERLLDWLERQGCVNLGLNLDPEGGASVHAVCPAGLRLVRDENGDVCLLRD
jgi:CheY-like chemotaxis protein